MMKKECTVRTNEGIEPREEEESSSINLEILKRFLRVCILSDKYGARACFTSVCLSMLEKSSIFLIDDARCPSIPDS